MTDQTTASGPATTGFEAYDARPWLKFYSGLSKTDLGELTYRNFGELVSQASRQYAQDPAFTTILPTGTSGTLTFAEVEQLTDQFAAYLRFELGLNKGDRVAIQSPNCLTYPIFLFGAAKAGCVIVNLNPLYTAPEIEHALTDSGAKLLVMIDMFADKLASVIPQSQVETVLITSVAEFFPPVRKFIVRTVQKLKKMVPAVPVPAKPFSEAIKLGAKQLASGRSLPLDEIGLDDLLALQYTGGTTGRPKGAMLTHRNLASNIDQSHNNLQNSLGDNRTTLMPLPMYHIFALGVSGVIYSIGGHNVLIPSPRPISNLKPAFEKYDFAFMAGVNTLFIGLLNEDWFLANPPKEMTTTGGGAAVQDAVSARWKEVTGSRIYQGYGLTETSPVVTTTPEDSPEKPNSIGIPVANTQVRIIDDQGMPVPVGERGEMLIKGPQVMKGYWQQAEATADVLTEDGWFHTGDIAIMDEDGFFYIVDRKTDMVLVSGFNVYPTEVEDAIVKHPGVLEVGVIGVPDEATGEAVRAYVVKRDPALTAEDIQEHSRQHLTGYKVPKQIVFRDELPKTPVGKVLRKDLRQEALQELGQA